MSYPRDGQVGSWSPPGEESADSSRSASARELQELAEIKRKGVPFLLYRDDSGAQRAYMLDREHPVTIGRGAEVNLRLAWDASVSLLHADAVRLGAHWLIGDDGVSRNGTFVNGERLDGRRRLRDGDLVRVGRTTLAFNEPRPQRRDATTITDAADRTGTRTLLFTDLVGSTELMDRLGDEMSDRLRREHFAILRRAAREHGGQEVKTLGDGLMVAFASALGAVACAVSMQQRIAVQEDEAGGGAMGLRIGLNAGEVISAENDYFGTPVVVAKRLCDRAASGQTLSSDVVRTLVRGRREYRFIALGALQLKGFTDPIVAYELDWRAP